MNRLFKIILLVLFVYFAFDFVSSYFSKEKFLLDFENYVERIERNVERKEKIDYDECELEIKKYHKRYEKIGLFSSWTESEKTIYKELRKRLSETVRTSALRDAASAFKYILKNLDDLDEISSD